MASAYKTRWGCDWPADLPDPLIGLIIGKKWRQLKRDRGIEIKDPWVPMLEAARMLLTDEYLKVSEWTEQHFHDWVMYDKYIIWGCASSSKSNDIGLLMILDWMVDPYDTVTLLGSTTKQDLKSRSWESVTRYHNALKVCNRDKFLIPGKISKQGQSLVNIEEDDVAASAGEKAGIQGRALNEDGRLQGAHARHVRLVVDELAEITNHEAIKIAMANLRVGTESFKFIGLANPESWENPSCQYCIPTTGISSVDVDTGSWMSTFGCFVRHHDGLKSPCVRDPSLRSRFPFLVSKEEVEQTVKEAGGNPDAPQVWKMVRGFPVPTGTTDPVVLDRQIAERNGVADPGPTFDPSSVLAVAAGIDPSWSSGGDKACRARCWVRADAYGRPYLDFTGGVKRLTISATSGEPPVLQMRNQVIAEMRQPYEAPFAYTAIDASANQGLSDDLMIYAGANCLGVNNSMRASDAPIRANDDRPAKDTIYDRGTEAWCVLAEFCKAGQVKGLPLEVVRALTTRRYAMKTVKGEKVGVAFPLRMEDKKTFRRRASAATATKDARDGSGYGHSPDEADACALAALAVKERINLLPFGYVIPVAPDALFREMRTDGPVAIHLDQVDDYDGAPSDGEDGYSFDG